MYKKCKTFPLDYQSVDTIRFVYRVSAETEARFRRLALLQNFNPLKCCKVPQKGFITKYKVVQTIQRLLINATRHRFSHQHHFFLPQFAQGTKTNATNPSIQFAFPLDARLIADHYVSFNYL